MRDQPDKRSYEHEKCADCRALKMPGYLFLLDKADKERTKDLGLCNLDCSSLAMILRCSQGGGGRISSSKRQLQLLSSPPCHCVGNLASPCTQRWALSGPQL